METTKPAAPVVTGKRPLDWKEEKTISDGYAAVIVKSDRSDPDRPFFSLEIGRTYDGRFSRYLRPNFKREEDGTVIGVQYDGNRFSKVIDDAWGYIDEELRNASLRRIQREDEAKEAVRKKELDKRKRHAENLDRRREEDRKRAHGGKG